MSVPFTWSYSQLRNFETCPKRHYHYDVAKDVKEPDSPSQQEGNATHKAFEDYIKSGRSLPLGLVQHNNIMAKLASMPGRNYPEQKLALTAAFAPVAYFGKGVWFRTVVDFCNINGSTAAVIDYKTGRPSEDMTQLQLLSATIMHYMPDVERVRARLLFVNHDQAERAEFVRGDLTAIWNEMLPRVRALQKARVEQEYPPKPSGLCVRYCRVESCPFHGRGTRA